MMNIVASWSFFLYFLYFFQEPIGSSDLLLDGAPIIKFDEDIFAIDTTDSNVTLSTTTTSTCPTCPVCPICPICTPVSPPSTTIPSQATKDEPPTPTPEQPVNTDLPISREIQSTTLPPIDTTTVEQPNPTAEQLNVTTTTITYEVPSTTFPSPPMDTTTVEQPTPTTELPIDSTITVTYEVPSTISPSPPIDTTTDEPPTPTPEQPINTDPLISDGIQSTILPPIETTTDETSTTTEQPDKTTIPDVTMSTTTSPSTPIPATTPPRPQKSCTLQPCPQSVTVPSYLQQTITEPLIIIPSLNSLDNYHSSLASDGPDVCERNSEFELLILVDSKADDMNLRSVIRSWLKYFKLNKNQTRIVFFVGSPMNPTKEINVRRENLENGDIILTNVPDTSSNYSTMKSVSSLYWVATQCKKAKFVLKIDSHTVVNVQNVMKFIRQNMVSNNTIWGLKHPVPMTHDVYFTGKSYLMTGDTASKVFCGALKPAITYNPNENEYITGLIAANEQIKVLDNENFEFLNFFTTCSKVHDNFIFSMPNGTYSDWINYTYLLELCEIYLKKGSSVKE